MTHYELLTKSIEEAADLLCRHMDSCGECFASRQCENRVNGMKQWLEMEDSEDDD